MSLRFSTLLAAVGVVHVAVAGLVYSDAVSTVIDEGVWNAVPDRATDADATFWYLFAGFLLAVLGVLVHRLERRGGPLAGVGAMLVAVGAFGQILKPTSPFWTFALIGVVAFVSARRRPRGRPIVGRLLGALALVHTVAVVAFYGDGLERIIDDGVVNASEPSGAVPDAAFWYVFSGLTVLTLSVLVRWCERDDRRALLPVGWAIVGLSTWGIVVMPTSGFWLPLAAGIAGVMIGRRARAQMDDGAQPTPGAAPVHATTLEAVR